MDRCASFDAASATSFVRQYVVLSGFALK
jgi:hypothetical protein